MRYGPSNTLQNPHLPTHKFQSVALFLASPGHGNIKMDGNRDRGSFPGVKSKKCWFWSKFPVTFQHLLYFSNQRLLKHVLVCHARFQDNLTNDPLKLNFRQISSYQVFAVLWQLPANYQSHLQISRVTSFSFYKHFWLIIEVFV